MTKMLTNTKMTNSKGFTLAEVLVTLAIIGVVAALTIPTLLQTTQDLQYKTAWKKTYSVLAQATLKVIDENGGTMSGVFSDHYEGSGIYMSHLGYAKRCNPYTGSPPDGVCWHNDDEWQDLVGDTQSNAFERRDGFVLSDGTLIAMYGVSPNCTYNALGKDEVCALVNVDVNGHKKPNTIGKDIFGLYITINGIQPYGSGDFFANSARCQPASQAWPAGWACSNDYLLNLDMQP